MMAEYLTLQGACLEIDLPRVPKMPQKPARDQAVPWRRRRSAIVFKVAGQQLIALV